MILILLNSWRLSYNFLKAVNHNQPKSKPKPPKIIGNVKMMRIQHMISKNLAQQPSRDPFSSLPTSKEPVCLAVPFSTSVIVKSSHNHYFPEGLFFYLYAFFKSTTFHCIDTESNETWILFALICCLAGNRLTWKNIFTNDKFFTSKCIFQRFLLLHTEVFAIVNHWRGHLFLLWASKLKAFLKSLRILGRLQKSVPRLRVFVGFLCVQRSDLTITTASFPQVSDSQHDR